MASTSALDTLIELGQKALDDAGSRLADSRQTEQQAQQFLQTLTQYHLDYRREMQRLMQSGMDALTMTNYRAFLGSLDNAIAQAKESVEASSRTVDLNQENWRNQHHKLNAYETLNSRRAQAENIKQGRAEQQLNDEFSARLFRRHDHSYSPSGF
jgi:flagellar FliJ protein